MFILFEEYRHRRRHLIPYTLHSDADVVRSESAFRRSGRVDRPRTADGAVKEPSVVVQGQQRRTLDDVGRDLQHVRLRATTARQDAAQRLFELAVVDAVHERVDGAREEREASDDDDGRLRGRLAGRRHEPHEERQPGGPADKIASDEYGQQAYRLHERLVHLSDSPVADTPVKPDRLQNRPLQIVDADLVCARAHQTPDAREAEAASGERQQDSPGGDELRVAGEFRPVDVAGGV